MAPPKEKKGVKAAKAKAADKKDAKAKKAVAATAKGKYLQRDTRPKLQKSNQKQSQCDTHCQFAN